MFTKLSREEARKILGSVDLPGNFQRYITLFVK